MNLIECPKCKSKVLPTNENQITCNRCKTKIKIEDMMQREIEKRFEEGLRKEISKDPMMKMRKEK